MARRRFQNSRNTVAGDTQEVDRAISDTQEVDTQEVDHTISVTTGGHKGSGPDHRRHNGGDTQEVDQTISRQRGGGSFPDCLPQGRLLKVCLVLGRKGGGASGSLEPDAGVGPKAFGRAL